MGVTSVGRTGGDLSGGIFELGMAFHEWLFPRHQRRKGYDLTVAMAFRNDTDETIVLDGEFYGPWFETEKPPTSIGPRTSGAWMGGQKDAYFHTCAGSMWFKIMKAGEKVAQLNIDYDHRYGKAAKHYFRAYLSQYSGTFSAETWVLGWRETLSNDAHNDADFELMLTYKAEKDKKVDNTQLSGAPSATVLDDKLYCFHPGNRDNASSVWCNVLDNGQWLGDTRCKIGGISGSPSATVYRGQIWMFYQGLNLSGKLYYQRLSADGSWSGEVRVENVELSGSPSVVVFRDKLYVVHQGGRDCGELWYNVFDGTNWSGDTQIKSHVICESPTTVVFNDRLHCFYQGRDHNGLLWQTVFDGQTWGSTQQLQNVMTSASPSAVVKNNSLYILHQGTNDEDRIWFSILDSNGLWKSDRMLYNVACTGGPGTAVYKGQIYCFYRGGGEGNQELWYKVI